jgi:uncharacterized membrane protein
MVDGRNRTTCVVSVVIVIVLVVVDIVFHIRFISTIRLFRKGNRTLFKYWK